MCGRYRRTTAEEEIAASIISRSHRNSICQSATASPQVRMCWRFAPIQRPRNGHSVRCVGVWPRIGRKTRESRTKRSMRGLKRADKDYSFFGVVSLGYSGAIPPNHREILSLLTSTRKGQGPPTRSNSYDSRFPQTTRCNRHCAPCQKRSGSPTRPRHRV
jgi:hypothetical protein